MRILIYGAGVIGSLYAVLFSKVKHVDVDVYARGSRLAALKEKGLCYLDNNGVNLADVNIIERVKQENIYDFVFITVRENQIHAVLEELKSNKSKTLVTMMNTLEDYRKWEDIVGAGKILPAFPGAGGSINEDVLDAGLTPALIQPTAFGEISGKKSERSKVLKKLFRDAHVPFQMVKDMHIWQLCHLAMVVPIADAYYEAENPERAGKEKSLMLKTAKRIKRNMRWLNGHLGMLSPLKMYLFVLLPSRLLAIGLRITFESNFGDRFMYQHSMKAPDEMESLHKQFYGYIKNNK